MNSMEQLSYWLAAEIESIDSKASEWLERVMQGDVSTEEGFRNINELRIRRKTLEDVMKRLGAIEEGAQKETKVEMTKELFEISNEEDGYDVCLWEDEEDEPIPDIFCDEE